MKYSNFYLEEELSPPSHLPESLSAPGRVLVGRNALGRGLVLEDLDGLPGEHPDAALAEGEAGPDPLLEEVVVATQDDVRGLVRAGEVGAVGRVELDLKERVFCALCKSRRRLFMEREPEVKYNA